jgi:hypothetical protein
LPTAARLKGQLLNRSEFVISTSASDVLTAHSKPIQKPSHDDLSCAVKTADFAKLVLISASHLKPSDLT